VAQRQEGLQALTMQDGTEIVDVPPEERAALEQILDESFEGLYLWHSLRTLREVETVRAAISSGSPVGLIMLKTLEAGVGYVFYVAVARAHRGTGVAGLLLRDALERFKAAGTLEVFASVEKDNLPSERLFAAEGFARTNLVEVSQKHGPLRALNMYRTMVVVPGEVLLHKTLG
jgi:ribosomal protein S18 acetylase RimI-like enzyme